MIILLKLYIPLLCLLTVLAYHFQQIICDRSLKKMAIHFQNGSYFIYFTSLNIISVRVNVKIYCINLLKILHFVVIIYSIILKICKGKIMSLLDWKYF